MIIDEMKKLTLKEIKNIYREYLNTQDLAPNTIQISRMMHSIFIKMMIL